MHTHTLHPSTHAVFLGEQRKDPITGDVLKAGDTVVCCAECGSAFLVDSWEYMGWRHCEQSRTLSSIPENKELTFKKVADEGELCFSKDGIAIEIIQIKKAYDPKVPPIVLVGSSFIAFVIASIFFMGSLAFFKSVHASTLIAIFSCSISFVLLKELLRNNEINVEESLKTKIQIFENKIHIEKGDFKHDFWKHDIYRLKINFLFIGDNAQEKEFTFKLTKKDGFTFKANLYMSDYKAFLQALKPWQKSGILQIQSENRYVSAYMAEIGLLPE